MVYGIIDIGFRFSYLLLIKLLIFKKMCEAKINLEMVDNNVEKNGDCLLNTTNLLKRLQLLKEVSETEFLREKHIKFSIRVLGVLPVGYQFLDSTRLVMAFFALSTLDLLDALDQIASEKEKLIDWIYALQVIPTGNETRKIDFGFRGSFTCIAGDNANSDYCDKAHLAMTYTALSTLIILGDDLSGVHKKDILTSLCDLQLSDGSFRPMNIECENDMRYVYCASCICYILQDWSHIDAQKLVQYIKRSRNYDGGIGQGPGLESHGGSTYCAIASLHLMGELGKAFSPAELKALKRWLVLRQSQGFQGRPNKPEDTCYTFWIGATLKILDSYEFVNIPEVLKFVLSTQDSIVGGMSKWIDDSPDMLHTYLGISGMLLFNENLPSFVHPALNISERAAHSLSRIHQQWKRR